MTEYGLTPDYTVIGSRGCFLLSNADSTGHKEKMFDTEKRETRFREIFESIKQKSQLSTDYDNFGGNLYLAFFDLLGELHNYDMALCVELIDLLHFKPEDSGKSTVSRLQEYYEGYSDFMLKTYMKLRLDPNDNLLQELVEFDLDHGVTVDQLVTSGWFYYHKWPLIQGLEHVVLKSKNVFDIMLKVALHSVTV